MGEVGLTQRVISRAINRPLVCSRSVCLPSVSSVRSNFHSPPRKVGPSYARHAGVAANSAMAAATTSTPRRFIELDLRSQRPNLVIARSKKRRSQTDKRPNSAPEFIWACSARTKISEHPDGAAERLRNFADVVACGGKCQRSSRPSGQMHAARQFALRLLIMAARHSGCGSRRVVTSRDFHIESTLSRSSRAPRRCRITRRRDALHVDHAKPGHRWIDLNQCGT
jgi:hypothetical protein